jgi:hypothetical protein
MRGRRASSTLRAMTELNSLAEATAARQAVRCLEIGNPEQALTVLRNVCQTWADLPSMASSDQSEVPRLRERIERAIEEIEIHYPGHALRTLRLAVHREPLG